MSTQPLRRRLSSYQSLEPIEEVSCEIQRNTHRFRMKICCHKAKEKSRCILAVVIPVVLCPLLLHGSKEARCAYVIALMACYWVFEVVHLSVTSLLPVVLFPLLGVMSTADATMPYMKDTIMLYLAGMVMAGAVEKCNLHNRIALKILLIVGGKIRWLMLGFMTTSALMSMWVSNMATTLMLLPVVDAVVDEICRKGDGNEQRHQQQQQQESNGSPNENFDKNKHVSCASLSVSRNESSSTFQIDKDDDTDWEKDRRKLHHGMLLGVAYAANLGGTGSLIGTAPNIVMYGIMEEKYPQSDILSFATWLLYNVPPMIVCVLIAWGYLYLLEIPKRFYTYNDSESSEDHVQEMIRKRYRDLGPVSFHEGAVTVLFGLLILLWFFRDPRVVPGWSQLVPYGSMIKDATPAIGIVFLMFLIPSNPQNDFSGPALIDWKYAQAYVPWGVLLLMGGSFSMAVGAEKSGLSRLIGESIAQLEGLAPLALVVVLTTGTAFATEICSNTATASVLLPMTAYLSSALRIHPIKLMMPVTIASSFAFMLPVATPPNAMVYEHSDMEISYMVRCGIVMNFVCIAVELVAIYTLGNWIFGLDRFPPWAENIEHFSRSTSALGVTNVP